MNRILSLRTGIVLFFLLALIFSSSACVVNLSLFPTPKPLQEKVVSGEGRAKIALLDISGVLTTITTTGGVVPQPGPLARFKEALDLAARDPDVHALVLRINSPGGTVTASDLVYHEIRNFKDQTGKPVIAMILDVGASGAYYVATAADTIIAQPTAMTGSIGVVMLILNAQGFMEKIGLESTTIKSGKYKDMGSMFRPLTPEERRMFQAIIDALHQRFIEVVVEGRGLEESRVRNLADGRILTAQQALEQGLIDEIGYLDDAIERAKEQAGVKRARVIVYQRPGEFRQNIYAMNPVRSAGPELLSLWRTLLVPGVPKFLYLWLP